MDIPADQLATLDAAGLFQALWPKYEGEVRDTMLREMQHRDEAFIDVPRTVAGEEIRMLTPRDFLLLDGFDSPFSKMGNLLPNEDDCFFFVWTLHTANTGKGVLNAFRRGRVRARVMSRDVAETAAEIDIYLDSVFIDIDRKTPQKRESRPASISFVTELIVDVASAMGPRDPFSGALLADVPIPRLLQYQRAVARAEHGEKADYTAFDSARSRCLEEVNRILAERRNT